MFSGTEGRETVFSERLAFLEVWYADSDNPVNAKMDLALSRITGGESCLDIGCRTGEALLRLQRLAKFRTLFGIDIDPENVGYCLKKLAHATNIFVSVGDVLELGFRANSLDCVELLDVLEHTRNPRLVLCEVERAAQKRGRLILFHFSTVISKLNSQNKELAKQYSLLAMKLIEFKKDGFHPSPSFLN